MKVNDIIWTNKMVSVMNDESQILFLVGATGCSKTLTAGHKWLEWLFYAPAEQDQFYMIFENIGVGVRNILQNQDSFYNMYDFMRDEYKESKVGGVQFVFHGMFGDKNVYLVGADNKKSWSKILGSNPDGIWLEELSVLHIDCVRESFGRAFSRRCNLIATTNGGLPTQEFYSEFLNHAEVQYKDRVPQIELSEMMEDRPYMHYYHFNMEDDAPHLTQVEKERLNELYPHNSFYYYSKILGCRGYAEGAAYAPLMKKETHLIDFEDIELSNLWEIDLFVDIGSNKDVSDNKKASTVAGLIGYSKDCQRIIVLECWVVPATSHDDIIKFCESKIEWWWFRYMQKFKSIVIDSAENILINTWKNKNRFNTINVQGAVKAYKGIITLVSRCSLKQQLLIQERLLWTDRALNNYQAHTRILLADDGSELDLGIQDNDMGDILAYGLTQKWGEITSQIRR